MAGKGDLSLLKLDSTGAILWQKSYGGGGSEIPYSEIEETSDGGYIAGGFATSFGAGADDAWVMKLNADGTVPPLRSDTAATVTNAAGVAADTVSAPSAAAVTTTAALPTVTPTAAIINQQAP